MLVMARGLLMLIQPSSLAPPELSLPLPLLSTTHLSGLSLPLPLLPMLVSHTLPMLVMARGLLMLIQPSSLAPPELSLPLPLLSTTHLSGLSLLLPLLPMLVSHTLPDMLVMLVFLML